MKKLLFSVIAFALITLSCNKYKDDFANLNARIDALAATVQGVAGLQTSITAIQGQLTSLTSALATVQTQTAGLSGLASGLATLTTNVATIQTALNTLATNVAAGNVTTQGLITTLTNQLATNQTAINNALTALTTLINSNQSANATLFAGLTTALNGLVASQTAQTTALATINAQNVALTALVQALTTNLATANLNIQILLANSQFYEGTLTIFDEATLAFAETLLNRIALIKGNVSINTTALSAGQKTRLDVVAGKMLSIIGNFTYTGAGTTFGGLTSISGNATFNVTGSVNVPALSSVGGNYTVIGADINDAAIASVLGNVWLDYANGYSSTSLTSIGGSFDIVVNGTTTTVNFPNLSSTGTFNGGTPSFPLATTVNVGAGNITSLSAPVATSVRLGQAQYSGALTISAVLATSIDLSGADSTNGALSVTGKAGSTINLANYRNGAGGSLTVTGPITLDLPKYVYGAISSTTVKTLTAAMHNAATSYAGLTILENITLGAAANSVIGLPSATLITLDATGTNAAAWISLTGYNKVTTVKVAGVWDYLLIQGSATAAVWPAVPTAGTDVYSSVTVSGKVNRLYVYNTSKLTSIQNTNTHQVGGPGSTLYLDNNVKLATFTSSSDFALLIHIYNNPLLTTLDLSSYVTPILGGNIVVEVYGNKISGTYTNAVAGTATTARVNTIISAAYLTALKNYLLKFTGVPFAPGVPTTAATVTFNLAIDDVDAVTAGLQSVDAALTADAALSACNAFNLGCYAPNVGGTNINTPRELSFVQ